jgi:hypothetical protein
MDAGFVRTSLPVFVDVVRHRLLPLVFWFSTGISQRAALLSRCSQCVSCRPPRFPEYLGVSPFSCC